MRGCVVKPAGDCVASKPDDTAAEAVDFVYQSGVHLAYRAGQFFCTAFKPQFLRQRPGENGEAGDVSE